VYGPEGRRLAKPLAETEEGILYADLDPSLIAVAKSAADPVGHYSRPDVFRLLLNRNANPTVASQTGLPAADLPRQVDAGDKPVGIVALG